MKNYIKHMIWFMRESQSFMEGHNKIKIAVQSFFKSFKFASDMCKWDKMTAEQREAWYLSGEGRVIEF